MLLLSSLLTICVIVLLLLTYIWIKNNYFSSLRFLPSPEAWPILGHIFMHFLAKDKVALCEQWRKEFKEDGVFKYKSLFPTETIYVIKPEWIKHILSRSDDFARYGFLKRFLPLLGNALLSSEGNHHSSQRRILSKGFTTSHMKHYLKPFDEHTDTLIKMWKSKINEEGSSKNIAVKSYFSNMTFDTISEVAFGFDANSQKETSSFVVAIRNNCEAKLRNMIVNQIPLLNKLNILYQSSRSLLGLDSSKQGEEVLNEVLLNRLNKANEGKLSEVEKNDLLSIMINGKDDKTGESFTDQLIKDNCFTFMFAGSDTTATALPILLLYLSRYPEKQEKARAEVQSVLNGKTDFLSYEDLEHLPYITSFIKEAFRLFPPVAFARRINVKQCTLGKYNIPKGTDIVIMYDAVNRDPEKFDFPDEFIPERYLHGSGMKAGTSMTFGYGPYNCIGQKFALLQTRLTITRLLQHFRFTIDPKNEKFHRANVALIQIAPALQVRVHLLKN